MKKLLGFCFFSVLLMTQFSVAKASAYDIYVNKNSTSTTEDGSENNPFKTISAALTLSQTKSPDQRDIFISNGEYKEKLTLNKSCTITGESKTGTIINGTGHDRAIEIKETSSLKNLKVFGGHANIYVAAGSGATIKSCVIEKAGKIGIEIAKSSTSNSEKVTITDCDIIKGDGKGLYINKRRISVENNKITDNDEEGIDIRAGVKGTIKKNTISKNGESGIELIVGSSDLKITNNKIKSNSASGISNQFYKDSKKLGSIELEKNTIQKNDNYGVQCASPSGGDSPKNYWSKSIDLIKNIFSGNSKSFAGRCEFPETTKATTKK